MTYLLIILPVALQVILVIHVLTTGQDRFWIYLLVFLPVAGSLVYIFMVLIPDIFNPSRRRAMTELAQGFLDPKKKVRDLEKEFRKSDTIHNRERLAEVYIQTGHFSQALELLADAAQGVFAKDQVLLRQLATAYRGLGRHEEELEALRRCVDAQGKFTSHADLANLAEASTRIGDLEAANSLWESLMTKTPLLEYRCRYGIFLSGQGRRDEALNTLQTFLENAADLPPAPRKLLFYWEKKAREEVSRIKPTGAQ